MIKKLFSLLLVFTLLLSLCSCKQKTTDTITTQSDNTKETEEQIDLIDIVCGFENQNDEKIIESVSGIQTSINNDANYVNSGEKSLKLSISKNPVPKFRFSKYLKQYNISEYDYLSFWVYVDYDKPISLTNSVHEGEYQGNVILNRYYINDAIEPRVWTKIKIAKGDPYYEALKYNLLFGNFIFCGTGEEFNNVLEYSVYLDDIRVYKKGMEGEDEVYVVDKDNNDVHIPMPTGEVGTLYQIPKIKVLGADGNEIIGAVPNVQILDPDKNAVTVTNNTFTPSKNGTYSIYASYGEGNLKGKYTSTFQVKLFSVLDESTELGVINTEYNIKEPVLEKADGSEYTGYTKTLKVLSPSNNEVTISNNKFTPTEPGYYEIQYSINKDGNTDSFTKYVWVSNSGGLVTNFSNDSDCTIFTTTLKNPLLKFVSSIENKKVDKGASTKACMLEIEGESFPTFKFSNKFPIRNFKDSGIDYVSFWVFNNSEQTLYISSSGCELERQYLEYGIWTRVLFSVDSFSNSFDWTTNEFVLYCADNQTEKVSATLFIDDIRIYKDGYSKEVDFSKAITDNDFNFEDYSGRMFSVNGDYVANLDVYSFGYDELLPNKATVLSLVDSYGAKVEISDDGKFTPTREGKHILTLTYEQDGILNSITKSFVVRPQLEFEPGIDPQDVIVPYGEANKLYDANLYKPKLWNKGLPALEQDVKYSINVSGPDGQKVEAEGLSFTPPKKGLYTLSFFAQDPITKEFASYKVLLGVFEEGKMGVAYDFEDQDITDFKSTYYYYGKLSDMMVTNEEVGGNSTYKAYMIGTKEKYNDGEIREPMFYLAENNILQNIKGTEWFSIDIYIKDPENRTFRLLKHRYYNWNLVLPKGDLNELIPTNEWVTIKVNKEDYESILGGYIFAGAPLSLGGQMWTVPDTRYITVFVLVDAEGYQDAGGITIYFDNIKVGIEQ